MDSILTSVKKMLGIGAEFDSFDPELIMHINSVLSILHQLGVEETFSITGIEETWSDYLSDMSKLEMIKTYVYMKVRLIFDPPTAGTAIEAINKQIAELEWRINVGVESN